MSSILGCQEFFPFFLPTGIVIKVDVFVWCRGGCDGCGRGGGGGRGVSEAGGRRGRTTVVGIVVR